MGLSPKVLFEEFFSDSSENLKQALRHNALIMAKRFFKFAAELMRN